MKRNKLDTPTIAAFLEGKSVHTQSLYLHFVNAFGQLAPITFYPTKTMIGMRHGTKCLGYITALGKNFVHVVFHFTKPYPDNLCFIKIAHVPGTPQYNHHFRMYAADDVTEEVLQFMQRALDS